MSNSSSRRGFLAAGLALPAAASAAPPQTSSGEVKGRSPLARQDRTESGSALVWLHDDIGRQRTRTCGGRRHRSLRHRSELPERQQRADGRGGAEEQAAEGNPLQQESGQDPARGPRRPGYEPPRIGHGLPGHLVPAHENEAAAVTEDLLEAQRLAKQQGKIRFAGVSTHFNMDRMLAHLAKLGQTDVALTTYNFAMRSVEADEQEHRRAQNGYDDSDPRGAEVRHGHRGDEDAGGWDLSRAAGRPALRRGAAGPHQTTQSARRGASRH